MLRSFSFLILILVMLGAVIGCSDDPAKPPANDATLVNGVLDASLTDFSLVIDQATHPRNQVPGPFVLQGQNIHYDDGIGALVVDLTLTNAGRVAQPEPVTITFRKLLPEGVTIINPVRDDQTFTCEFANDDGRWTPGETSLPLTISFLVDPGGSVAFAAEIGLGFGPESGVISGYVWSDVDQDGVWDEDEAGQGGIALDIFNASAPDSFDIHLDVLTLPDGSYTFTGLSAGLYEVYVRPRPDFVPTTPALNIVLTEDGDGVGSFDGADFGVKTMVVDHLVLDAVADASVRADLQSRMNDNYGAGPILAVGTGREPMGEADAVRSLVRFDLQMVDQPIMSARLEMSIAAFQDGSVQTYDLGVYAIAEPFETTPWIEGNGSEFTPAPPGVAWVDTANGVAWIGAEDGGDANNQTQPGFIPDAFAHALVNQASVGPSNVVSWDVTRLVNAWAGGMLPNLGLMIRDTTTDGTFRQIWFGARDGLMRGYDDPRVQPGPRLVLEFLPVPE